jgi:glutamate dehydrogenase
VSVPPRNASDDTLLLRSIPAARRALIERIANARIARSATHESPAMRRNFLRAYFRGVAEEDLAQRSPEALAAAALQHLKFGSLARLTGKALVKVFNPDMQRDGFQCAHTLAMVVTDDMPFLVDSLGIVFSQAEVAVHLIVHPVLAVSRDRRGILTDVRIERTRGELAESWQLYEIDRQTDAARIADLQQKLEAALRDVRLAVADWLPMRKQVRKLIVSLERDPPPLPEAEVTEARRLLEWMEGSHFLFVGYRHYRLERGASSDRVVPEPRTSLGILRRQKTDARASAVVLRGPLRARARDRDILILTQANAMSSVHRATYLDYVGVKTFGRRGEVSGEHRFLGLWTSTAYHFSPREIPVLRKKVERVIGHFGLDPQSHDAKAVLHVLETYPRDELFQAPIADLIRIARGVVNLYERRNVRMLARRDPWQRFYSLLIYVPRDRYSTQVRQRIEQIVLDGFGGSNVETQVQISDSNHARLHVVVRTDPDDRRKVDLGAIEKRIAQAATNWTDRLRAVLVAKHDEAAVLALAHRYRSTFPLAYEEDVAPADAFEDLADLEALRAEPQVPRLNLYRPVQQNAARLHLKIVKLGDPVPISDLLPMLENFGLRVIAERPYELAWPEGGAAWIQDFELEHRDGLRVDIARIESTFKEAFSAAWRGEIENDGFNRLLLATGLTAREIVVLRAYCRYLLQTGVPFSQIYMERTLVANAAIAKNLVRLFELYFEPRGAARALSRAEKLVAAIGASFDTVTSLDEDRILRAYLNVIRATLRTNFYQMDSAGHAKSYVSFKLDPQKIPDLPLPRPKFEIFVYSPRVEGVHLRMGHVARGGIRWSDRREDFRTEVLGLMKAQNVKNTLIVPVGAKGGFVVKRPPAGSREELQAEVIACYETLIRGMLDLTDNIVGNRVAPPLRTVRRDADDTYLVVAADKGTATFSDIANAISQQYGFWLGDAFASGGSAGYDHKKMGITARGAWECVKRHFRELGVNVQSDAFTAIGIGDMSGDVFGNAMLMSRHTRLKAAFNHQHIFLDPAPDAATSFAERQRLFKLPRSSWDDYERRCISRGGGIYPRAAKSITLSAEAQAMLGMANATAPPNEITRAILRMPVDLLWNGGIGTYVKASGETNGDVGDRSNDAVRVNGAELAARVVGEGGNLGLSQRGRIEYALGGGRLNTDFIDNSGGVNTSDLEVNIKILLNPVVAAGRLTRARRNQILARMTNEVAGLVLRNNYLQSQAISTLELRSAVRLSEYQHLMNSLERSGELNRALEFLPNDEQLAERRKRGAGLTRPEIAIMLSYSKIWLSKHLLDSDVPADPYLSLELKRYFPGPVRSRFARAIAHHRLRREIIAMATTNSLVNRMGPAFVSRAQDDTGAPPARIARAYSAAREIFDMREMWERIESLDNRIPAKLQYTMMYETARLLRHVTYWLLEHRREDLQVDRAVAEFRRGARALGSAINEVLVGVVSSRFEAVRKEHLAAGVPAELAARIASLDAHNAALDIIELATVHRVPVPEAARIYFEVGARIGLDWLREQIEKLPVDGQWQAVARTGLRDSASTIHRKAAERVLTLPRRGRHDARVTAWANLAGDDLSRWQRTLNDMRAEGTGDFATLSVGVDAVRRLTESPLMHV